jgi:hypothetical protein
MSVYVIPLWLKGHCGNPNQRIKRTFPVLETTVADSEAWRENGQIQVPEREREKTRTIMNMGMCVGLKIFNQAIKQ